MKQLKKVGVFIGILILSLPMFLNIGLAKPVIAAEGKANVTIHKKKMTTLPNDPIQNTGNVMTEFDQYQGLADVEFKAYDVTAEFYEKREAGMTVDKAKEEVIGLTPGSAVATGTTDSNGNLTLELPKKSGGKDAVYTIVETAKDGVTAGVNMVIAFPVYEILENGSYGDVELNDIHLYPKNEVTTAGSLTVTKIGTGANELLDGAVFAILKEEGGVTKYISGAKDGLYTWSEDKTKAFKFITRNNYSPSDATIAGAPGSEGILNVSGLEVGSYILEETKAPANAAMIDKETKKTFEITKNQTAVEVTVKNDTSKVEKTTPNYNGKDYAIGEEIDFEISVNIPLGIADKVGTDNKYTQFDLIDSHSEALTFVNDTTKYGLFDGDTVINVANYTVTETTNGFTVAVNPAYIPSLSPGGTLRFEYKMYLNDKADPTQGYKNKAQVENGHTDDKTPPEVEVRTGGKRFIKIDGDVTKEDTPLAGAKFVIRNADEDTAKYLKIDTDKKISWVDALTDATEFTTGADGLLDITGLKYGTYFLEETEAPNDYVKLTKRIGFTVDKNSYGDTQALFDPQKVPNKHKGTLPSTGGMGIYFFIGGGLLLVAVGAVYFSKRRKELQA